MKIRQIHASLEWHSVFSKNGHRNILSQNFAHFPLKRWVIPCGCLCVQNVVEVMLCDWRKRQCGFLPCFDTCHRTEPSCEQSNHLQLPRLERRMGEVRGRRSGCWSLSAWPQERGERKPSATQAPATDGNWDTQSKNLPLSSEPHTQQLQVSAVVFSC